MTTLDDDLLRQATQLIVTSQFGSAAMLQRRLHVGFADSHHLLDHLEQAGIVGPSRGSQTRDVLYAADDLAGALNQLTRTRHPDGLSPAQAAGVLRSRAAVAASTPWGAHRG